jgi:hypothetical protein
LCSTASRYERHWLVALRYLAPPSLLVDSKLELTMLLTKFVYVYFTASPMDFHLEDPCIVICKWYRSGSVPLPQKTLDHSVTLNQHATIHRQQIGKFGRITMIEEIDTLPREVQSVAYEQAREWLASSESTDITPRLKKARKQLAQRQSELLPVMHVKFYSTKAMILEPKFCSLNLLGH